MQLQLKKLFLALICFGLGVLVFPSIDLARNLACNTECMAQLLYKNTVFFELRDSITKSKHPLADKFIFNQTVYTPARLVNSGIKVLIVLDSGEFLLTSNISQLVMLAKPAYEGDRLTWRCRFFSDSTESPKERNCSYN